MCKEERLPDYDGEKYLGDIILEVVPSLHGEPVYYTNGDKIPYEIVIPKLGLLRGVDGRDRVNL